MKKRKAVSAVSLECQMTMTERPNEMLTLRVGRKKFHLKIACWNVIIFLKKGNSEMKTRR